jgi:O-antigen ligase
MKKIISGFLFILYPSVLFYRDYSSIDLIGHQWFYISIVNILSFLYLIYYKKNNFFHFLNQKFIKYFFIVYGIFIILSIPSFFLAQNSSLVVVEFFRISNTFLAIFLLSNVIIDDFNKLKDTLFMGLVILLAIENIEILISVYKKLSSEGFTLRDSSYQGLTGNINIAAFSILIKVPFLFYLYFKTSSVAKNILFIFIFSATLVSIYFIQSRASFVALLLFIIGILYYTFRNFRPKYIVILGIIPIVFFFLTVIEKSINNTSAINRFQNITQDQSTNLRLRYYKNGLYHLLQNPIYGCGLGNWKIQSIAYESKVLKDYQVSYHMHNDFLQMGAELGFLGLLVYMSIFGFLLIKVFTSYMAKNDILIFLLGISLLIYLVDAMFNFPIERTISQSMFIVISSMILVQNLSHEKEY